MRFTSEDLMKAKKALAEIIRYNIEETYDNGIEIWYENPLQDECYSISKALEELERLLPKPKRIGDLKCNGKCPLCPCIYVCNDKVNAIDKTLYEVLELGIATFTKTPKKMNEEVHNVIKAILDKEVVEE